MIRRTSLRSRRALPSEPTLGLITFQLRHTWFGLPLPMAKKVLPYDSARGDLVTLQNTIPVVDIAALVYSEVLRLGGSQEAAQGSAQRPEQGAAPPPTQNLLVVELLQLGEVGLLVEGKPGLRRVRQSAFLPPPTAYVTLNRLRGVRAMVAETADSPAILLLEVEALLSQV